MTLATTYISCVMNARISFDKLTKFLKFTNNAEYRAVIKMNTSSVCSIMPSLDRWSESVARLAWLEVFNLILVFSNQQVQY